MIEKIGHYSLENPASIYDEEAMTTLELAGRTAQKVNECVEQVNDIPQKVAEDVQKHIDSGKFNVQVDKYAGELKKQVEDSEKQISAEVDAMETRIEQDIQAINGRVNNLVNAVSPGSTTRDAEVIDIRTDYNGNAHASAGDAIRTSFTEGKRDWYQAVGGYGYIGWNAPFEYTVQTNRNGVDGLTMRFTDSIGVRHKGSISAMPWTTANCADIAGYVDITDERNAIIFIPAYMQWVFNMNDGIFHFRTGANLLAGDISLVKTGYGYPVGGTLFDEYSIKKVDTLEKRTGTNAPNEKVKRHATLIDNEKVESFIFFSDPHTLGFSGGEDWRENFNNTLAEVETAYNNAPVDFVICGGDWLNNGDTIAQARYKLGVIQGATRKAFGERFYHVVGNHDTNYQGISAEGAEANTGALSRESIAGIWNMPENKLYYTFKGRVSRFIVLDTGTDWTALEMDDYKWNQLHWLANTLMNNEAHYVGIFGHMLFVTEVNGAVNSMVDKALAICMAFNRGTTYDVNGTTYDFKNRTGKVHFYMFGHLHTDCQGWHNDIPYLGTMQLCGNTTTFDMCLCNHEDYKLRTTRIGDGWEWDRQIGV